jgi:hypothetical protein
MKVEVIQSGAPFVNCTSFACGIYPAFAFPHEILGKITRISVVTLLDWGFYFHTIRTVWQITDRFVFWQSLKTCKSGSLMKTARPVLNECG